MMILVRYSCNLCWLKDVEVPVEARGGQEDIIKFMERVFVATGQDHKERKPYCQPKTLKNLKVPVNKQGFIGGYEES